MVRIIDIEDRGLSLVELMDCLRAPVVALRHRGRIVGQIQAADEIDIDDEIWMRQPEQAERGERARENYAKGRYVTHEALLNGLGLERDAGVREAPDAEVRQTAQVRNSSTSVTVSPEGRTLEVFFHDPILRALQRFGGEASASDVLDAIEREIGDRLTAHDRRQMKGPKKEVRWRNTAQQARRQLVQLGLLRHDSPRSRWQLSPKGRREAAKLAE